MPIIGDPGGGPGAAPGRHLGGGRLLSVDVVRGSAMVLVILQHSYLNADARRVPRLLDAALWLVTQGAAVAFVAVSGTMLGYALRRSPDWKAACRRYAARALFLLVVAHFAISAAAYPSHLVRDPVSPWADAWARQLSGFLPAAAVPWLHAFLVRFAIAFYITDVIGLCILVSPAVILATGAVARAVVVAALLISSPLVVALWHPAATALLVAREAVFGFLGAPSLFWWPIARWLGIFLAGSIAGEALARLKRGTLAPEALVRALYRWGVALVVCSILLTAGYKALKWCLMDRLSPEFFRAVYPAQTTTLLPGYLGVLASFLGFLLQRIDVAGRYGRISWLASVLGRTSLFTFVLQFGVVLSTPALLGWSGSLATTGFLLLFAGGLAAVWLTAYAYGRLRGWVKENDFEECLAQCRVPLAT